MAASEIYRAHPLLDPLLPSRHPFETRRWLAVHRAIVRDPGEASRLTLAFIGPVVGRAQPPYQNLASYFQDADQYLDDLLCLAPRAKRARLRPLPETRHLLDFGSLIRATFEAPDPRLRYEAQRKLYLAKLLFDIDHCRRVRDGVRHRVMLEDLLHRSVWSLVASERAELCRLGEDGRVVRSLAANAPDAACWRRFRVRRLEIPDGQAGIDLFHHHIRFKREPASPPEADTTDGPEEMSDSAPCWPSSRRRSGSILSKMIRKGIGDPHLISDILGASFVVGDRRQAHALERHLVGALGGPFRCRDRVDTLSGERDRDRLDRSSAGGFRVIKQVADVLVEDRPAGAPYFFPVELQILIVEGYLLTLDDANLASHAAYKRRQFASGLFPVLFPLEVFGPSPVPAEGCPDDPADFVAAARIWDRSGKRPSAT